MAKDEAQAILLGRMPQQAEVRVREDDWTGQTDAAIRRKLQNRLNQRIWRKKPNDGFLSRGLSR